MKHVMATFSSYKAANDAVEKLEVLDVDAGSIGIFSNEEQLKSTTVEEGDAAATAAGVTVGGLAGLVLGVSAVTVPGVGPIIAAGSLATLVGSAVLGAGAGGLVGALVDLGLSEEAAETYLERVKTGNILLTAQVSDENESVARELLKDAGALDVDTYTVA